MANTMNTTMYFSTALIAVMYLSWPIAMSFLLARIVGDSFDSVPVPSFCDYGQR